MIEAGKYYRLDTGYGQLYSIVIKALTSPARPSNNFTAIVVKSEATLGVILGETYDDFTNEANCWEQTIYREHNMWLELEQALRDRNIVSI